jgi:hypothetical protein
MHLIRAHLQLGNSHATKPERLEPPTDGPGPCWREAAWENIKHENWVPCIHIVFYVVTWVEFWVENEMQDDMCIVY